MYDADANVCYAVFDGQRSRSAWADGRGGRKWQRWWRRRRAGQLSLRRVRTHIRRHYNPYHGTDWVTLRYDSEEVRQHLFVVRLGGEGRYGRQWPTRDEWCPISGYSYVVAANGEGHGFRILAVGKWRKHEIYQRGKKYHWTDYERRQRYKDRYRLYDQYQLQRLRDDD